jgi:hypothetical protein
MTDSRRSSYRQRSVSQASAGGGNAVYGLGLIGALVFFWQQADSFGQYLLAILRLWSGQPFWCTRCSKASSSEAARPPHHAGRSPGRATISSVSLELLRAAH